MALRARGQRPAHCLVSRLRHEASIGVRGGGKKMKINILAMAAMAVAALAAAPAAAQGKKTLAIVVKGLDNPFFEQINLGCKKWKSENASSEYECLYTGPASSAD